MGGSPICVPGGWYERAKAATYALACQNHYEYYGTVERAVGTTVSLRGLRPWLKIGDRVELKPAGRPVVLAEMISVRGDTADAVALDSIEGISTGKRCRLLCPLGLPISDTWIGRVVNALGQPIDGAGALLPGPQLRQLRAPAPSAGSRASLGSRVDLGVRALDVFTPCRRGQRLGLFAGSGVGKSTLLGMIAQRAEADIIVVALVGERGRELREFLANDLGPEGLKRTIVVCATSDAPAPLRRDAALSALTIAEYFADNGRHVMLLMDSVTRFAQALREIGLSAGELPVTRGYTPSVFSELPRLLERAGPREDGCPGTITGIFTVLVEGDDHDEPIADAIRGTLDGHVVLDRSLAERGHYPAVDILRSVSRTALSVTNPQEAALIVSARRALAIAAEQDEFLKFGGRSPAKDSETSRVIDAANELASKLRQTKNDCTDRDEVFRLLVKLFDN